MSLAFALNRIGDMLVGSAVCSTEKLDGEEGSGEK